MDRPLDLHRFGDGAHTGQNTRECNSTVGSRPGRPACYHLLEVFDLKFINVRRASIQQGFEDRTQDKRCRTFSHIAPLAQQTLHAVSNHLHVLAAKYLAGKNDINNVIFAEPVEV